MFGDINRGLREGIKQTRGLRSFHKSRLSSSEEADIDRYVQRQLQLRQREKEQELEKQKYEKVFFKTDNQSHV